LEKTVVIAVRVPEKVKKDIEELGFKVSVFIKEAIQEELKRRKSEEAMKWIKMNRVPGKEIGFDSVKIIRQMRETM
jgi:post-segregation antitoxin (ccd killing protein)